MRQNIDTHIADHAQEDFVSHPQIPLRGEEFGKLVETYSPKIYRLALKILNDAQDAEDVLQETFLKALRGLESFEGRSSISTWLYRIAINEAFMLLRKRKPDVVLSDTETEGEDGLVEPKELVDWCCLPEKELLSSEGRRNLDAAMQKLSPVLQAVFLLRDVEELSTRETAETLGIQEAAVKTRLLRARLKLREGLAIYYAERLKEGSTHE